MASPYRVRHYRSDLAAAAAAAAEEFPGGPVLSFNFVAAITIYSDFGTLKVRKGCGEEIPLVQGKEQWLHFAGAAMKRYPTSKVRETQVRW